MGETSKHANHNVSIDMVRIRYGIYVHIYIHIYIYIMVLQLNEQRLERLDLLRKRLL